MNLQTLTFSPQQLGKQLKQHGMKQKESAASVLLPLKTKSRMKSTALEAETAVSSLETVVSQLEIVDASVEVAQNVSAAAIDSSLIAAVTSELTSIEEVQLSCVAATSIAGVGTDLPIITTTTTTPTRIDALTRKNDGKEGRWLM